MDRLQQVQNNLARVVLRASLSESVTVLRQELHWLSVRQRVVFELTMLTFKMKNLRQLAYLSSLLHEYQPIRRLRSSAADFLHQPLPTTTWVIR